MTRKKCLSSTPGSDIQASASSTVMPESSPTVNQSQQFNSSSLRKLLSSHSSIYNALNNPELDGSVQLPHELSHSPKLPTRDFQNSSPDLQFSVTSWQSVHEDDVMRRESSASPAVVSGSGNSKRPTSSILSSVSDDNDLQLEKCDSTIVVPYPKKVMVFETDEEGEGGDDDAETVTNTYTTTKFTSVFSQYNPPHPFAFNSAATTTLPVSNAGQDSFIMPRMSVSDNKVVTSSPQHPHHHHHGRKNKHRKSKSKPKSKLSSTGFSIDTIRVSILCTVLHKDDTSHLISTLQSDLASKKVFINSFLIDNSLSNDEISDIKGSDLVFIVNDGSLHIVNQLLQIFGDTVDDDEVPKISVINLITVNYFVNLFDMINNVRPYQMWKTSSLKAAQLSGKMKDFVEGEQMMRGEGGEISSACSVDKSVSLSYSAFAKTNSTMTLKKKPNYKQIEKQFKNELKSSSSSLDNSDPLSISSKFTYLNIVSAIIKKLQNSLTFENVGGYGRLWILCSFSLGIGLGVGIANGATTAIIGVSLFNNQQQLELPQPCNKAASEGILDSFSADSVLRRSVFDPVYGCASKIGDAAKNIRNDLVEEFTNTTAFAEFRNMANLSLNYIYSLNLLLLDNVRGGLEKVFGIFMYINY